MQRIRFIGTKFILLLILSLMLPSFESVFNLGSVALGAENSDSGNLTDIKGHWAEKQLSDWSTQGHIQGYADGTFQPDNIITRLEFMAFVNRSFGFTEKVSIHFRDLAASNWAYDEVAKAVAAGYIEGYEDGTIGADRPISRQEAAIMIARLIRLDGTVYRAAAGRFSDASVIAEWSREAVGAAANAGLLEGYEDGKFKPEAPITRAEAVVILDRAIVVRYTATYNQEGTYGPSEGVETVRRDVVVNAAGVSLRNMRITGNLILAEGIGAGEVFLENVTIEGTTTAKSNGVQLNVDDGSTIVSLLLEAAAKVLGKGQIRKAVINEQAKASTFEKKPDKVEGAGSTSPSPTANGGNVTPSAPTPSSTPTQTATPAPSQSPEPTSSTGPTESPEPTSSTGPTESPEPTSSTGPTESPEPTSSSGPTESPEPTQSPAPTAKPLAIVSQGEAHAVIVKPVQSSTEINEATTAVADYIGRATGVTLSVYAVDQLEGLMLDPSTVTIRIGAGSYTEDRELADEVGAMHPDGFIIVPDNNQLIITSPTLVGTRNGAYAFLEKYVGVTWLFPGEEWVDVPQLDELLLPKDRWKDEPTGFALKRTMNMGSESVYGTLRTEWKRQNRTISASDIALGHNLFNLFPVAKYGDTAKYPNFYPDNKPPAASADGGWQPCFSNPATITEAVYNIKEFFRNNPQASSYSLAVNDVGGFCEGNLAHPLYPNKVNSVGLQDMSDIYYKWVNEVAEGVLADYPDKWFGVYAYREVTDAPSFKVNPRVIPVITKDRLTWVDPGVEARGKAHMEAWSEKAEQLGWYDYMLSYVYPLPRVYPHLVEELYSYAQENNVLVHHWDMHPVLGDGPQPWLIAKLGWSMEQRADTLLDHWYQAAVGPEAAPYLKQYYDLWEQFWRTKAPQSSWFQSSKDYIYLSMRNDTYLELAKDELIQSRSLLETVLAKAKTTQQKTRAEQLLGQLEYYEVSAFSYPHQIQKPTSDNDVLALLNDMEQTLEERLKLVKRRPELIAEFNQNPTLRYPSDPISYGETWTGWNADELWLVKHYLEEHGPLDENNAVMQRIHAFQKDASKPKLREFANLLDRTDIGQSLAVDTSFEEADIPTWNKWRPDYTANIEVTDEQSFSGTHSLRFTNAKQAGVWKYVDVQPGLLASSVKFYTPAGTTSKGIVQIVIELHTGKNKLVYYSKAMTLADHAGQWTEINFLEEMPAQINGRDIQNILINTQINNAEDATVYLDDLGVYQARNGGAANLIDVVNGYILAGELTDAQAQPMLGLLESADQKYQLNEMEPYVGLLADFIIEAEQLRSAGVLSEAYSQVLVDGAYALIRKQLNLQLSSEEIKVTRAGTYKVPVTIKNNGSVPLNVELSGTGANGIQLQFASPVTIPANQSLTVEGTLTVPVELGEGDYSVDIRLGMGGKDALHTRFNVAYYDNLLNNPSFEKASTTNPLLPSDWSSAKFERSNEQAHSGSYAVKVLPDPQNPGLVITGRSHDVAVTPGAKYRLSGWVYSENSNARFGLRQTNQAGASLSYSYAPISTSGPGWQYFEVQLVPRADATILQVYLRLEANAGAPVWFDDMKLEIIPTP
ncbi:DUF4838 domain-containing protein [Paenibacillus contaminans]|uniref:SLH domain-containing protein n=1 Tax=Paenibacillus contaminans TaxID=450362 RepID=A0A329MS55_9BACL|nr:DUF4838 domain-containing protein [Paenibacillus contaminans]RAV20787.1 hypothetical protein DQG23_14920 [Paenibacillus contaminans]